MVSENSQIDVTVSVKQDEKGGQGYTFVSVMHQRCEHALFYMSVFSTSYIIWSVIDGKIEQHVCIHFLYGTL